MTTARRVCGAVPAFAGVAIVASMVGERGPLADVDHAAFAAVRARRSQAGVIAARGISALAEPGVTYPAAIVAGIGACRRAGWRRACVPLLVVVTGAAARRRLSRVIARPRPPAAAWLIEPEGFSLPSKHTTIAALTAGACVRAAGARSPRYAAPALAAAAVGASRVYLGVHWPADVLAGWMFAAGWLWLTDPGRPEAWALSPVLPPARRPASAWPPERCPNPAARNRKVTPMDTPGGTDVRCSTVVFRDDALLLIHRVREGADDWTLPGGTPRAGESMAACARRETREETGLTVEPTRVAFVLEALRPGSARRTVDLVFLASPPARGEPEPQEPDREARFVPLELLPELSMRPPLAGYLRALNASGAARTAAYLGNMWRPAGDNGARSPLIQEGPS